MKINDVDGVKYITFDIYEKYSDLRAIFSTRVGGVSTGVCDSLNLAFSKEAKKENVYENYRRICNAADISYDGICFSSQIHDINLRKLTKEDKGTGFLFDSKIKGIDGIITGDRGVVLTTFYADCVPLYFFEPNKNIIASSHAGWRGTVNNIAEVTISKMVEEYNIDPSELLCAIGPSIHQCCFEVDYPVVEVFKKSLNYADKYIAKNEENNKYYIDLQNINKINMINAGVKEEKIEIADICTKCNGDIFYSHRNMGSDRGSMVAMMEVK